MPLARYDSVFRQDPARLDNNTANGIDIVSVASTATAQNESGRVEELSLGENRRRARTGALKDLREVARTASAHDSPRIGRCLRKTAAGITGTVSPGPPD